jgi:hypothetical protein
MTLLQLGYIVKLHQKIIINCGRAGIIQEAFVEYPKKLFAELAHRKTDENHENISTRTASSVSNIQCGKPPRIGSYCSYYTHLLQSSSGKFKLVACVSVETCSVSKCGNL